MKRFAELGSRAFLGLALLACSAGAGRGADWEFIGAADPGSEWAGVSAVSALATATSADDEQYAGRVDQLPGWPITLTTNQYLKPWRGAAFGDLDRDGVLEIIVSNTDSMIYAWDMAGQPMPGFPFTVTGYCQYPPIVVDLEGDGDLEIVQAARGSTSNGRLYILDHAGQVLPGFPMMIENRNMDAGLAVADLDSDGVLEIIVPVRAYPTGQVHIVEIDGTRWGSPWPFISPNVIAATPAIGDVDNDGQLELVILSYLSLFVVELDATVAPGWPVTPGDCVYSYESPALADLDHDGDLEIAVGSSISGGVGTPRIAVYHHDGALVSGWPFTLPEMSFCPPAIADIDGDGDPEILDGYVGDTVTPGSPTFFAFEADGSPVAGFPFISGDLGGSEGPITAADVDGDGKQEIFADSNMRTMPDNHGYLYGVDDDGTPLEGFPLRPVGWTYLNGAQLADMDGDGHYELAVQTYDETQLYINLYTLPFAHNNRRADWPTYHSDAQRTGLYHALPLERGDTNCDGTINALDINPFVRCMTNPAGYAAQFPYCDWMTADVNCDGAVNALDINPFVQCITGVCPPCP